MMRCPTTAAMTLAGTLAGLVPIHAVRFSVQSTLIDRQNFFLNRAVSDSQIVALTTRLTLIFF